MPQPLVISGGQTRDCDSQQMAAAVAAAAAAVAAAAAAAAAAQPALVQIPRMITDITVLVHAVSAMTCDKWRQLATAMTCDKWRQLATVDTLSCARARACQWRVVTAQLMGDAPVKFSLLKLAEIDVAVEPSEDTWAA